MAAGNKRTTPAIPTAVVSPCRYANTPRATKCAHSTAIQPPQAISALRKAGRRATTPRRRPTWRNDIPAVKRAHRGHASRQALSVPRSTQQTLSQAADRTMEPLSTRGRRARRMRALSVPLGRRGALPTRVRLSAVARVKPAYDQYVTSGHCDASRGVRSDTVRINQCLQIATSLNAMRGTLQGWPSMVRRGRRFESVRGLRRKTCKWSRSSSRSQTQSRRRVPNGYMRFGWSARNGLFSA
jgi:hypothetical protein